MSTSDSYEEFIIAVDFFLSITSPRAIYWYQIFEKGKQIIWDQNDYKINCSAELVRLMKKKDDTYIIY